MSNQEQKKIIFLGTPDFAVPAFNSLTRDSRFNIISVFTQVDKKSGRGLELISPPIKIASEKKEIPVYQFENINKNLELISDLNPDAAVLIAFGQILKKEILAIPKFGFINVHASLLPKYRGSSCIQAPILNGDKKTGITIMKIDSGLDTGPIIFQKEIKLEKNETAESLHDKLAELSAQILPDIVSDYLNNKIIPKDQDNSQASYAPELKKEDGKINWNDSAKKIERMVRAYYPWPGTWTTIHGKKINIKAIDSILELNSFRTGEIFLYKNQVSVQCGNGALVIKKLQLEGKKEMSSEEFLRGHKEIIGQILE